MGETKSVIIPNKNIKVNATCVDLRARQGEVMDFLLPGEGTRPNRKLLKSDTLAFIAVASLVRVYTVTFGSLSKTG